MNTAAAPPLLAGEQSQPFGAKRALLLVVGSIVVLVALALLTGGGAAAWGLSQRDASGYLTSGTHELSTDSYALASESLDVGSDIPAWLDGRFATIRVEASSPRPVFIGIGRVRDVERYLADVQNAQITEFETDPFSVSYRRRDGTAEPALPASQDFWRIQASGPGTQTISWAVEEGKWSVVAMNADGTRGVSVDTRLGARISSLGSFAIGLLAAGALLLLVGGGLMYLGIRRPRLASQG
jgi:hypothetical protein